LKDQAIFYRQFYDFLMFIFLEIFHRVFGVAFRTAAYFLDDYLLEEKNHG